MFFYFGSVTSGIFVSSRCLAVFIRVAIRLQAEREKCLTSMSPKLKTSQLGMGDPAEHAWRHEKGLGISRVRTSLKEAFLLKFRSVLRGQLKRVLLRGGQYKSYEREETKRTIYSRAESSLTSQEMWMVGGEPCHCSERFGSVGRARTRLEFYAIETDLLKRYWGRDGDVNWFQIRTRELLTFCRAIATRSNGFALHAFSAVRRDVVNAVISVIREIFFVQAFVLLTYLTFSYTAFQSWAWAAQSENEGTTGWTDGVRFPGVARFFFSPHRPYLLYGPPSLVSNGCRVLSPQSCRCVELNSHIHLCLHGIVSFTCYRRITINCKPSPPCSILQSTYVHRSVTNTHKKDKTQKYKKTSRSYVTHYIT
jgi:hypothetical protein